VTQAYGGVHLHFGPEYIIPKPFDRRVLLWEASAVAGAAMRSGVARKPVDLDEYRESLESRLGLAREAMRVIMHKARRDPRTVVFPEGANPKILRASAEIVQERIARPILLGSEPMIRAVAAENDVKLDGVEILDPARSERLPRYAEELYRLRQRKGLTMADASQLAQAPNYFGAVMLRLGEVDALVSGVSQHYPDTIRPLLEVVQRRPEVKHAVGVFMLTFRNRTVFVGDATVNMEPDAECLAEIAILTAATARQFGFEPKVAMLSFSNFGSVNHRLTRLVQDATRLVRDKAPGLVVDGEMQADTAVSPVVAVNHFPFSAIKGDANVLVFPDLTSGNIAYKLLHRLGNAEVVGPILVGLQRPAHVLHQSLEVPDIVNVTALAVAEAQSAGRPVAAPVR
jgi:malate dehydrogenase (oxaloacetate-decarboxylating)(NADP+)